MHVQLKLNTRRANEEVICLQNSFVRLKESRRFVNKLTSSVMSFNIVDEGEKKYTNHLFCLT